MSVRPPRSPNRQVLLESALLAVMGGIVGLLVAMELAEFLVRLAFPHIKYIPIETAPSIPVLGFTFVLSLITGVVFGMAPAWSAARVDPAIALRASGRGAAGHSTLAQRSLVALQAAISLVLRLTHHQEIRSEKGIYRQQSRRRHSPSRRPLARSANVAFL